MSLLEIILQEIKSERDLIPIYGLVKAHERSKEESKEMLKKAIREKTDLSDFKYEITKGTIYLVELCVWNLMTCSLFYNICNLIIRYQ